MGGGGGGRMGEVGGRCEHISKLGKGGGVPLLEVPLSNIPSIFMLYNPKHQPTHNHLYHRDTCACAGPAHLPFVFAKLYPVPFVFPFFKSDTSVFVKFCYGCYDILSIRS